MKALVGAFNQEKALVGAFSVIVQPVVEPMEHYTALVPSSSHRTQSVTFPSELNCIPLLQCSVLVSLIAADIYIDIQHPASGYCTPDTIVVGPSVNGVIIDINRAILK